MHTSRFHDLKRKRDTVDDEAEDGGIIDGFMDDESEPHRLGTTALPVANLPDSFDGVPQDGMEYLFTVRREEKRLPFVTRAHNPYARTDPPKQPSSPRGDNSSVNTRVALPREEWRSCFTERFRNFRKNIQQPTIHVSLPGAVTPVNVPEVHDRDRWWAFFRGDVHWDKVPSSRQHANIHAERKKRVAGYEEELPRNKENMRAWIVYDEPLSWEQDEGTEAHKVAGEDAADCDAFDAEDGESPLGDVKTTGDPVCPKGESAPDATVLPTFSPVPQAFAKVNPTAPATPTPREPTPSILGALNQKAIFRLLQHFTLWIRAHFDPDALPPPPKIPEHHPQEVSRNGQLYNFTPTHARWIFALLSRVDAQLTSEEISVLRKLAREIMKVINEEISMGKSTIHISNMSSMGEAACWIIVAAVAGVWGQTDLWFDAEQSLL